MEQEKTRRRDEEQGKNVVLFITNGGWVGHVLKDMKKACKGAKVISQKAIRFDSTGGRFDFNVEE